MLEIVFDPDFAIDLDGVGAVAATSASAVDALARRGDFGSISALPLYCVGDRTASSARDAGFHRAVSAGGDVDALVEAVVNRRRATDGIVLYAAGRDRTGDLDGKLTAHGFSVRVAEIYRAEAKTRLSAATAAALMSGSLDGILIFSARTAEALVAAAGRSHHMDRLREVAVYAISENAAKPLASAAVGGIVVAAKPDANGLIACLPAAPSK